MNRKGFTLVELLGSLVILVTILCIGLYSARGTLATTLTTMNSVSENEIISASESYILEYDVTWINNDEEYTCLSIINLVDAGYFDNEEVTNYEDKKIKVVRDTNTKVVSDVEMVDECN